SYKPPGAGGRPARHFPTTRTEFENPTDQSLIVIEFGHIITERCSPKSICNEKCPGASAPGRKTSGSLRLLLSRIGEDQSGERGDPHDHHAHGEGHAADRLVNGVVRACVHRGVHVAPDGRGSGEPRLELSSPEDPAATVPPQVDGTLFTVVRGDDAVGVALLTRIPTAEDQRFTVPPVRSG